MAAVAACAAFGAVNERKCEMKETIIVAADPFAVGLKKAIVAHLEKRGFAVKDMGATVAAPEKPYFESAVEVCRALQKGEAKRAFLFCGTGIPSLLAFVEAIVAFCREDDGYGNIPVYDDRYFV